MTPDHHRTWATTAILIAVIAAVTAFCIAGPAPELAGWFR